MEQYTKPRISRRIAVKLGVAVTGSALLVGCGASGSGSAAPQASASCTLETMGSAMLTPSEQVGLIDGTPSTISEVRSELTGQTNDASAPADTPTEFFTEAHSKMDWQDYGARFDSVSNAILAVLNLGTPGPMTAAEQLVDNSVQPGQILILAARQDCS